MNQTEQQKRNSNILAVVLTILGLLHIKYVQRVLWRAGWPSVIVYTLWSIVTIVISYLGGVIMTHAVQEVDEKIKKYEEQRAA